MSIFERAIDIFDIGDEARIIYSETGLTPRQLAEQRAELLEALKDSLVIHAGLSADESADLASIRQIIAKCEANP